MKKRLRIVNWRNSTNKHYYTGKFRKLPVNWTISDIIEFQCLHSVDCEDELVKIFIEEINNEIISGGSFT